MRIIPGTHKSTRHSRPLMVWFDAIVVAVFLVGLGAFVYAAHQHSNPPGPAAKPRPATHALTNTLADLQFKLAKGSPSIEGHNGITTDGTYIYTIGDKLINKYLPSANWTGPWKLVASNPKASAQAKAAHLGAGAYNPKNGYLYTAAENYKNTTTYDHQRIAVFRAKDLSFVTQTSIAAQHAEVSGLTLDLPRGLIYVSSFIQSDRVYKYHLSNYSYAGYIKLSQNIPKTQCITYRKDSLYIGEDATNRVYRVGLDGHVLEKSPKVARVNLEGIDYTGRKMLILDEQNTRRVAWSIPTIQG